SLTLSCMPHCWPQKQQCVFTRRSGSMPVSRRMPEEKERCGPKASMICSFSRGRVAMGGGGYELGPGRGAAEEFPLSGGQKGAFARGTNELIVPGVGIRDGVIVSEPLLHMRQILRVHDRHVRLAAPFAF